MATQQIEDPVKRKIAEYALITVSIWIMVVGIYFFKFPNNFSFGGVTWLFVRGQQTDRNECQ